MAADREQYAGHINKYKDLLGGRLDRDTRNIEEDGRILDMLRDINPEFGSYVIRQAQARKKHISAILNEVFRKHLRQSE